jgi:hypothetical protein
MVLALNNPARLTAFHCYFTPLREMLRSVRTGVRGVLANCNSGAVNCPLRRLKLQVVSKVKSREESST